HSQTFQHTQHPSQRLGNCHITPSGRLARNLLINILVSTKMISMFPDAEVLAAVASPRRREILRLVWTEELSAGDIHRAMPDVTFGAVSLQLKTLLEAGLVEARAEHRNRIYRARRDALGPI